jgi:hypothetical protein
MAFNDILQTLFMWAVVMLLPLLSIFLQKPAWAKVLSFIFLYPVSIMYIARQDGFHLNPPLVFAAAGISLGVAAILLRNPTIRERVSDPTDSRITGPAYYAGISGLFLFLLLLSALVPNSPFKFYPGPTVSNSLGGSGNMMSNSYRPEL